MSNYELHNEDCVTGLEKIETGSIDYCIFSPPFSQMYVYSDSVADMGNCANDAEYFRHFSFLVEQLARVMAPGRNVSIHCMLLPTLKSREGFIGLRDFRGEIISMMTSPEFGFIFHSEQTIWKDPVIQMQRTHAITLLHAQLKKDSAMSGAGLADYLCTFRAPGENKKPIKHTNESFPVSEWQQIASPVWMDINPSDTLQYRSARENKDEKHICPLQLSIIRRALRLWSAPGEIVLSPFMGIGSEGFCAVEMGRNFVGYELKESYFRQAKRNIEAANRQTKLELSQ